MGVTGVSLYPVEDQGIKVSRMCRLIVVSLAVDGMKIFEEFIMISNVFSAMSSARSAFVTICHKNLLSVTL